MKPGSEVPAAFEDDIAAIVSRLARALKLGHAGRTALIRELDLFQKACVARTLEMVKEEFVLTPRDESGA